MADDEKNIEEPEAEATPEPETPEVAAEPETQEPGSENQVPEVAAEPEAAAEPREVDSTERCSALRSLWLRKIKQSAGLERGHSVGA